MSFVVFDEKVQIIFNGLRGDRTKPFALLEWQLEYCAAQMLQQDQQMIGIDQCLLWGTLKEIFRMMGEELVNGTRRCNHHCHCGFKTASRATRLLTRGSDGAR